MVERKSITVNYFDSQSRLQVLSNKPKLSSNHLGWNSFNLAYFNYHAYELPFHKISSHSLGISLNSQKKFIKIDNNYQECDKHFGFVTILPSLTDFWAAWSGPLDFIVLSIEPAKLANFARETIDPDKVTLLPLLNTSKPDSLITGIALALKQYLEQDPLEDSFYVEHLENALYAYLLQNYCSREYKLNSYNGLPAYKLKFALDYIDSNLSSKIAIAEIAKLVDLSQGYFSRLFRESIGISPYSYIIQQRIKKAQKLLYQSNLSLCDIASESGFSTQSKMTQYFRSYLGITPKQYRDSQ